MMVDAFLVDVKSALLRRMCKKQLSLLRTTRSPTPIPLFKGFSICALAI